MLLIAIKDVRILLKDRASLLILIVAPLVVTFIAGAAFSGLTGGGSSSPIQHIPVIVVNHDQGVPLSPNFGNLFSDTLVKATGTLDELLDARTETDEAVARQQVRQGKAAAAVIIPADFSASMVAASTPNGTQKVNIEIYRDAGSPTAADIVSLVARQLVNGFVTSSIASLTGLQRGVSFADLQTLAEQVSIKARDAFPITVQSVAAGKAQSFNLLQFFAPAMAVFFLNFTMSFGVLSIMEERDKGTLQRLMVTPTARLTILVGKFVGTYMQGVLQLTILIIASTLLAPVLGNADANVWGTNIPALIFVVLLVTASSIGVGTLIVGLAKDRQQATYVISSVSILFGIIGGTFFGSTNGAPPMGPISYLSLNYWAHTTFFNLASANTVALTNVVALVAIAVVFFGVGITLFNRRVDI